MAQCKNCKAVMGCSCNQRKASDGTICCSSCIHKLEETLRAQKKAKLAINAQGKLVQ